MQQHPKPERSKISLDLPNIKRMGLSKTFDISNSMKGVNSFDFNHDGSKLIVAGENDCMKIYDCVKGKEQTEHKAGKQLWSKKYGVKLIKFCYHDNNVIYGSTKSDHSVLSNHALRLHSLHENKYVRYLQGHKDTVLNLSLRPKSDTVISSSKDMTVRVWDIRSPSCTGVLDIKKAYSTARQTPSNPIIAIDPQGLIFAVGITLAKEGIINLYAMSEYDKGPFGHCKIPLEKNDKWGDMKFSPCGDYILITTTLDTVILIKSFEPYQIVHRFKKGNINRESGTPLQTGFLPTSEYVYVCSESRNMEENGPITNIFQIKSDPNNQVSGAMYSADPYTKNSDPVHQWKIDDLKDHSFPENSNFKISDFKERVDFAGFNPVYGQFVTGTKKMLNFWTLQSE